MRNDFWLLLIGVLILSAWGCGKGEYDRRLSASLSGINLNSSDEDEAATPAEAFALLLEKGCMFFDPSTGVRDMTLEAAKSANKVTQFDENASYDVVLDGSVITDADTESLPTLGSRIAGITLAGGLGDGAMANVVRLSSLTWLNLLGTNITDKGLNNLGDLANVQSIRMMDNSSIGDDALVPVLAMENLKRVYLKGPFTNVGLEELSFNQYLESVEITLGGEVTQEIIDYLTREMQDTTITAK